MSILIDSHLNAFVAREAITGIELLNRLASPTDTRSFLCLFACPPFSVSLSLSVESMWLGDNCHSVGSVIIFS